VYKSIDAFDKQAVDSNQALDSEPMQALGSTETSSINVKTIAFCSIYSANRTRGKLSIQYKKLGTLPYDQLTDHPRPAM